MGRDDLHRVREGGTTFPTRPLGSLWGPLTTTGAKLRMVPLVSAAHPTAPAVPLLGPLFSWSGCGITARGHSCSSGRSWDPGIPGIVWHRNEQSG